MLYEFPTLILAHLKVTEGHNFLRRKRHDRAYEDGCPSAMWMQWVYSTCSARNRTSQAREVHGRAEPIKAKPQEHAAFQSTQGWERRRVHRLVLFS